MGSEVGEVAMIRDPVDLCMWELQFTSKIKTNSFLSLFLSFFFVVFFVVFGFGRFFVSMCQRVAKRG